MNKRPSDRKTAPLYEERFEHDACGVGFVADAGGRSHERVLPLALAGLAALSHRGAFGADGVSSDGAGVALPLDALVAGADRRADDSAAGRPGHRLAVPATGSRGAEARPGARGDDVRARAA